MPENDELDYLKWRVDRLEGDAARALNRLSSHSNLVRNIRQILSSIPNSQEISNALDLSDKELREDVATVTTDLQEARLSYQAALSKAKK